MNRSEAYFDIVWRQFKKNRFALAALWLLVPLALIALFAPAIASNQPLIFHSEADGTIYPWFRALFNPEEPVDFVFNMVLVGFFPWLVLSLVLNSRWKRRGVVGRRRVGRVAVLYATISLLLVGIFCLPSPSDVGVAALRPSNKYNQRTFVEESYADPENTWAIYVPVARGPVEQDNLSRFKKPFHRKPQDRWQDSNDSLPFVLGTDNLGRDVLVQMIYGTRIALTVGFVAVGIYMTIGIVIGSLSGYFGGWIDIVLSRVIEVIMLFPAFFLILTLVGLMGPSIYMIMVVIGLTRWTGIARLIRGEVLKQRSIDYVAAARALGASHGRVMFRHILPNAISPAMVAVPFGVAGAIITEAGLSLLGFGVRPPTPTWGTLLKLGSDNYSYWWLVIVPSVAIFFTVTVFNLIGSGSPRRHGPETAIVAGKPGNEAPGVARHHHDPLSHQRCPNR